MAVYKKNQEKVLGSVVLIRRNQETFGRDIEEMIAAKITFDQALRSSEFSIMAKQRLRIVKDDLFEQLDALNLCGTAKRSAAAAPQIVENAAVAS